MVDKYRERGREGDGEGGRGREWDCDIASNTESDYERRIV